MAFFHAMEKISGSFPRNGKLFSTAWKTLRAAPAAAYLAIFVLAAAVRGAYVAELADHPAFRHPLVDAGEYHALAKAWAEGQRPLEKLAWQPWFYPLALAKLYGIAGPSVAAARALQIAVGALVCVLVAALAFALWPRPACRWLAGLAAALYGPFVHGDAELLAEPWAALWLAAAALAAVQYRHPPRDPPALAFGILGALLLFTRPPALAAWLALLAWAALALRAAPAARPAALRHFVLLAAGFGLAALPFVEAIHAATGVRRLLPVTGGLNFYIGNSARPAETINIRPGCAWENLTLWPLLHGARSPGEQDAFFRRQAVQDIRAHPGVFLRHLAAKARQFISSREIPRNLDLYAFRPDSRLLRALAWKAGGFGFPFGLVLGLAVLGAWARRPASFGLLAAIAGYAAAIIAVHVCGRYRLPALPLFLALAAAGALAFADALRARRFRAAAAGAGMIVLLAAATSLGAPFPSETLDYRAELFRLSATTAFEHGDFPAAEADALLAVQENPREAQAWNQLGLLDVRRGDLAAAEDRFRRAVDSDPACFPAWFNLGKAAAKRGAPAEAIACFREGLRRSPAYLPAWIDLGDLLRNANPAEARECYLEALRLRPGHPPALRRLAGAGPLTAPSAP